MAAKRGHQGKGQRREDEKRLRIIPLGGLGKSEKI